MELIDQVYAVALRTELAKAWERLSNQYMANIFIYVCVCLLTYTHERVNRWDSEKGDNLERG